MALVDIENLKANRLYRIFAKYFNLTYNEVLRPDDCGLVHFNNQIICRILENGPKPNNRISARLMVHRVIRKFTYHPYHLSGGYWEDQILLGSCYKGIWKYEPYVRMSELEDNPEARYMEENKEKPWWSDVSADDLTMTHQIMNDND